MTRLPLYVTGVDRVNSKRRAVRNVKMHDSLQAEFLLRARYERNIRYERLSRKEHVIEPYVSLDALGRLCEVGEGDMELMAKGGPEGR